MVSEFFPQKMLLLLSYITFFFHFFQSAVYGRTLKSSVRVITIVEMHGKIKILRLTLLSSTLLQKMIAAL